MGLFVDPDDAGEFVDDFFDHFVGLEFGIGLKVEDEYVLAAKTFAARVDELGGAEEGFDANVIVVLVFLSFFFCFFVLGVSFLASLFWISAMAFWVFSFSFFCSSSLSGLLSFLASVETSSPFEIEESVFVHFVSS